MKQSDKWFFGQVYKYMYMCIYIYMDIYIHIYIYMDMDMDTGSCIYIYISQISSIHEYMCVYMYTYTCIVATCTDLQIQQNGSQAKQSWSRPSLCFHVHCEVGMGQKSQKLDGECQ